MKNLLSTLTGIFVLVSSISIAQPVLGLNSFFTPTTIALQANTACTIPKTTVLDGWLFSVSSTSNCGFNHTNSTGGDGRLQYLVGFGTLIQASFGSSTGSEFGLIDLVWGVSTSSWTSRPMTFVGYKNGLPVPGATLNATTPAGTGITNTAVVSFSGNAAFNNVDNITVSPSATTCSSILFIESITVGPTVSASVTSQNNVSCNGGCNGSATVIGSGGTGPYTYAWSPSGGTGSTASGLCAGSYTLTVTDANGTWNTQTVLITQPPALATSTAVTNAACFGGQGSATVTASGGTGAYTYTWSSGSTTTAASPLSAGVYTVRVADANNCTSTKSVIVTQPSALATTTAVTNAACNGANGSATITASGGAGAYTYTWSSGPTTSVEPTLLAGTYTVRVTDANNCSTTRSITITQPSALVTSTGVTNVLCNGGQGSATVAASGGTGAYTYTWSSGPTTSVEPTLMAGTYTVRVTDANNCNSIKSITITEPSALVTTTAVTNVLCNGGMGSSTVTASGGTGAYSYTWSSGPTTSVAPTLPAGTYTVRVTDGNNCTSTKSVTLSEPPALVTATAVTNVLCNGGTGSATVTASGGSVPLSYLWSTAATGSVITALAGVHTVTVTDANNCTSIKSVNITQPSALVTTTMAINILCNGGTGGATITASGGTGAYNYLWSNSATTSFVSGIFAGVYTATVTDANNCTSIKSINVSQPAALITGTAIANVLCNGGVGGATLTASGGTGSYTYLWTGGATTSVLSNVLAGVYSATVTDANNCASSKTVTITEPSALTTSTAVINVLCNGGNGSATITASGGTGPYSYLWSNAATASVIVNVPSGAYSATVTDANNCTSIKSVIITQPSVLVSNVAVTGVLCNGGNGSATVTASGGTGTLNYLWSTGGTASVIIAAAGAYTVTVTDANTCTSTNTVNIIQPAALVTNTTVTNVLCSGGNGSATITASGGTAPLSYLWSTGAVTSVITTVSGVYTATVTDSNNCTSVKSVNITQPTALVTATAISAILCNGGTGSATITASGGTPAFSYLWSTGATTSVLAGVLTGVYTATVSDANNCTSVKSVNVTEPTALVTSVAVTSVLCNGGNGTASVTASGGTGILNYLWSNGGTGSAITTTAGAYTVTVTDANNCTGTRSVNIIQPAALATTTLVSNIACFAGMGSATVIASGGIGALTYSWVTGSASSVIANAYAGTYSVTVKDANNCSHITSVTITQPTALNTFVAINNALCYGNPSSTTITATGGTGPYSTLWQGGSTGSVFSTTLSGIYSATVTDANNCTSTHGISLTVPAALSLSVSAGTPSVCSGSSFTLFATAVGGTPPLSYTWSSGPTSSISIFNPTVSGVYTAIVQDANLCGTSRTIAVNVLPTPSITAVGGGSICPGTSFTITPSGAATYTYTGPAFVDTGTTVVVTPIVNTTYTVSGTGSNGCLSASGDNAQVTVIALAAPQLTITGTPTVICSGETASLTVSGANSYTWISPSSTASMVSVNPSVTTVYTVFGTGTNVCNGAQIFTLEVNITPTVTVNSGTICSGDSFTINAAGADTYIYSGGSAIVAPGTTTFYTVIGTSTAGCVSSNTAISNVTVNVTPTLAIIGGAVCAGTSFTLMPTGGSTYTFSGGSDVVSPLLNTTYTVTGTSAEGCAASNAAIAEVTVHALPFVMITSTGTVICAGETMVLSANGALTYIWSTTETITAISVTPVTTTAYTVTGWDVNGCMNSHTLTLEVSDCTGLRETSGANLFSIYPNPNNGEFIVSSNTAIVLTILNDLGQLVKTVKLDGMVNKSASISNLANGIYFVAGHKNNQIVREKIIVNK